MKRRRLLFLCGLAAAAALIWYAVLREERGGRLKVAFLDVGQGDAIYIEAPDGRQLLVDGGPPGAALRALSKVMPFYDRSIDVLVVSNPDADHIGGLIDVLGRYRVAALVEPGTKPDTETYRALLAAAAEKNVERFVGRRGMRIDLGGGAVFAVLFPDRDASRMATNDGSLVGKLSYGATSVLFDGDAPQAVENYLASLDGRNLRSSLLKVGHHGSKTSTSPAFLGFVSPAAAIISVGKDNKYGHPNKETLDTLKRFGVPEERTDEKGTIVFVSDGEQFLEE